MESIPSDRARAHVDRLIAELPTATPGYIGRLAGLSRNSVTAIRRGARILPETEERVLAVTVQHMYRYPPRVVPAAPVQAHAARLMRIPGASVKTISGIAGITDGALGPILDGTRPTVEPWLAAAVLGVTPVAVQRAAAFTDPALSIARIRALQANGWTMAALDAWCGHDCGDLVNRPRMLMKAATAEAIERMYEALRDTPGPSRTSAARARRLGYRTPDYYDDDMQRIVVEDEAWQEKGRQALSILGLTLDGVLTGDVAMRLGMTAEAVVQIRQRAKLRSKQHDGVQVVQPGQDDLVAAVRERLDGIEYRERVDVLDDPGIDYAARWKALWEGTWRREDADEAAEDEAA